MVRLPRGWKWAKDQNLANVVRLATDGRREVWLSREGNLVITAPGEASEAPAEVVLAVLFPRGDA